MTTYIWLDIETAGLNPNEDALLEVGLWATTPRGETVRRPVALQVRPVLRHHFPSDDSWALNTHTANGLLSDIELHGLYLSDVAERMTEYIEGIPGRRLFAGSSVHFDRAFLLRMCPEILDLADHRMIDVSTMSEVYTETTGSRLPTTPTDHRVLTCLSNSIARYRMLLEHTAYTAL